METETLIMDKVARKGDAIHLYGDVGGQAGFTADQFSEAMGAVKGDMTVFLNSLGGDVFEAQSIVARMRRHPGRKTVVIDGVAASAASVIAMGADRIVMAPGAMMMIHMPYCMAVGTSDELRSKASALDEALSGIVELYAKRTGNEPDQIRAWMDEETWMGARTAMERGFCDAIEGEEPSKAAEMERKSKSSAKSSAPVLSASCHRFRHAPEDVVGLMAMARRVSDESSHQPTCAAAGGKEHDMKQIMSALGLAEDAAEEAALERIGALESFRKDALAIADKAEAADALKILDAYKADAVRFAALQDKATELEAKATALQAKVDALESERLGSKVSAIIDGLKREGRMVPAQEEWARTLGMADLASLEAYAKSAPVIVQMSAASEPASSASAISKPFAEMSADEKAELYAQDRDLYEKLKNG